jgi:hypothetical protein
MVVEVHHQIAGRLRHPGTNGMRGEPDQMHPAPLEFDYEQHVQPG